MELLDALRLRHRVESMHLVGHLQFVERFICALCVLVDSRAKGHWLRRASVKTLFFFLVRTKCGEAFNNCRPAGGVCIVFKEQCEF